MRSRSRSPSPACSCSGPVSRSARTYALLIEGGFGSVFAFSETLTRATPLALTGLSAAVAFRARLFNIGAEGQLYAGALAAIAVGGMHGGSGFEAPLWLLFPTMMAAAALAGALLLLGPALMKARLGVDEVVTTLLLNFIVLLAVGALLDGPMKDPLGMGWPRSVGLQPDLELGKLIAQTRVHTGLIWAVVLAVGCWALLKFTVLGFDIRAVGANPRAAAFAGVGVTRTVVLVAMLSGALAGLAGAIEVAGRTSYVTQDLSPGYGYSGIVIAMLAGLHPLGRAARQRVRRRRAGRRGQHEPRDSGADLHGRRDRVGFADLGAGRDAAGHPPGALEVKPSPQPSLPKAGVRPPLPGAAPAAWLWPFGSPAGFGPAHLACCRWLTALMHRHGNR